jgi:hypothetical protein
VLSPELETLDQLLGGELPLATIRPIYPSTEAFMSGILGLLSSGDVTLFLHGEAVPHWRWRELFVDGTVIREEDSLKLKITELGSHRIA